VRLRSIVLAGLAGGSLVAASEPIVAIRPPEVLKLKPGQAGEAAVEISVRDGFHVQANPAANEFLIPLTIAFEPTDALTVGEPRYPAPMRYRLEGTDEDLLVYGGVFTVPLPIRSSRTSPHGLHTLQGNVKYQACDERSCRPPATAPVEVKVRVLQAGK
jgi:DsbC/DsbD-like thiol-disulfide interchange protein